MSGEKKLAISIGDSNGVGCEIILRELEWVLYQCGQLPKQPSSAGGDSSPSALCAPIICAHKSLLESALQTLLARGGVESKRASSIHCLLDMVRFEPPSLKPPPIHIAQITAQSGAYSFASFVRAVELASQDPHTAVLTLPIHKAAWKQAGVRYAGHTEYLRAHFKQEAIMVLGCKQMLVALFCDHIPLARVSERISVESYKEFLCTLESSLDFTQALVLGFNPHCGDCGAIGGEEDALIQAALESANAAIGREAFVGVVAPDSAFTPAMRERFCVFVAPYHDVGLAPLKALYFDQSINISLNLPIVRTSVDHGVAFDIAYQGIACTASFRNALHFALTSLQARF